MEIRDVNMDFAYGGSFTEASPEAYERLILDVLLGDPPLFPRHEEVEASWRILDPVEEHWAEHGKPEAYEAGTWGPRSADEMLAREGRTWRRPRARSPTRTPAPTPSPRRWSGPAATPGRRRWAW
jgi:glucose-6-phosphate 1-dehydrogenase